MISGKSILTNERALLAAPEADFNRANLKLAALANSTSQRFMEINLPEAELVIVRNYEAGVQMVIDDEVDALVADMPICLLSIMRHPNDRLATLDEPMTIEPIGIANRRRATPSWRSLLDSYLHRLRGDRASRGSAQEVALLRMQQVVASDEAKLERLRLDLARRQEFLDLLTGQMATFQTAREEMTVRLEGLEAGSDEARSLAGDVERLEKQYQRFNRHASLTFEAEAALRRQIENLQEKIVTDRRALAVFRFRGTQPEETALPGAAPSAPPDAPGPPPSAPAWSPVPAGPSPPPARQPSASPPSFPRPPSRSRPAGSWPARDRWRRSPSRRS